MNTKQSSHTLSSLASEVLRDGKASKIEKELAGSVLSQASPHKETSAAMEKIASEVLRNSANSDTARRLAASVLSQSDRERR